MTDRPSKRSESSDSLWYFFACGNVLVCLLPFYSNVDWLFMGFLRCGVDFFIWLYFYSLYWSHFFFDVAMRYLNFYASTFLGFIGPNSFSILPCNVKNFTHVHFLGFIGPPRGDSGRLIPVYGEKMGRWPLCLQLPDQISSPESSDVWSDMIPDIWSHIRYVRNQEDIKSFLGQARELYQVFFFIFWT